MRRVFVTVLAGLFGSFVLGNTAHASQIALVSLASGQEYRESVKLGLQNKQEYCAQHGHDFICGEKSLDTSRSIAWSKLLLILNVMENDKYKWIFWTDADALIMNTGLFIEDLIDENYNLIINNDFNGFNSGHFLIKNCEWSRRFLREAYTHEEFINHTEWDQGAMLATLQENSKYSAKTKIIPQRLMNSFPDAHGSLLQGTYQTGDFILHFAGVRKPELLKIFFEHYYPLATDQTNALTYEHYLGIHDIVKPPYHSPLSNWSTEAQNKQYATELAKHSDLKTIAQIGLSNGSLAEVFFIYCPNLIQSTAYIKHKRYDPFCRAACDFLSRKYRSQWKESTESPESITAIDTPLNLIHLQPRTLNTLIQARKLADEHTLVWINDYNLSHVQQIVSEAIEKGVLEIITTHTSGDREDFRAWIEVCYLF